MSIQKKLFVTLLVVTSLLMYAVYLFLNWSMDKGMLEYVNNREMANQQTLANHLSSLYARDNNWFFLKDNYPLWDQILRAQHGGFQGGLNTDPKPPRRPEHRNQDHRRNPPPHSGLRPPPPRGPHNPGGARNHPRIQTALVNTEHQPIVGFLENASTVSETPVTVSGEIVGWLLAHRREQLTDQFDLKFIAKQREILLLVACLLVASIALLTWLLARHFLVPLKQLTSATSLLTQGHYSLQLNNKRNDELGQLQRDFNELANTLAANDTARKRWLADISHELRTPLSVIRAEIEAMLDGIRPLDITALNSMAEENKRITKLVDDLHELSNAELGALRYRKQWVDLDDIISKAISRHTIALETARLEVQINIPDNSVEAYADEDRINQLIDNLLANSIKYTNPNGILKITLEDQPEQILLRIEDSAPSVSDQDMSRLCDYLYRVENSRSRETGGSGLGLSICQRIVEAHQGTLIISASLLGGLCIDITLNKECDT